MSENPLHVFRQKFNYAARICKHTIFIVLANYKQRTIQGHIPKIDIQYHNFKNNPAKNS